MGLSIEVPLTPELEPFKDDLSYFFETMVRKLHCSRHKGFAEKLSIMDLMGGLGGETDELIEAIRSESQFNTSTEAADVANMAFLIAMKVWQMTKEEYKEVQKDVNS